MSEVRTRKQKIIIDKYRFTDTFEILPLVPEKPKVTVGGRKSKTDIENDKLEACVAGTLVKGLFINLHIV